MTEAQFLFILAWTFSGALYGYFALGGSTTKDDAAQALMAHPLAFAITVALLVVFWPAWLSFDLYRVCARRRYSRTHRRDRS